MANRLKTKGRFGDTELVVIPRVLADVMDLALYGSIQNNANPMTGKREYFLGNLFGGLFNTIKSGLGSLASGVGNMFGLGGGGAGTEAPSPQESMNPMPEYQDMIGGMGAYPGESAPMPDMYTGGRGGGMMDMMKAYAPQAAQMAGGLVSKYAPQLGQMAGGKIGQMAEKFIPGMGNLLGNFAGNALSSLGGMAGNQLQGNASYSPMDYARNTAGQAGSTLGGMESSNPFMRLLS